MARACLRAIRARGAGKGGRGWYWSRCRQGSCRGTWRPGVGRAIASRGSAFRHRDQINESAVASNVARQSGGARVSHILVVEDERNLALGLRANLEVEGYEVTVAENGEAALDVAATHSPDLIILDLMLPGIDGF